MRSHCESADKLALMLILWEGKGICGFPLQKSVSSLWSSVSAFRLCLPIGECFSMFGLILHYTWLHFRCPCSFAILNACRLMALPLQILLHKKGYPLCGKNQPFPECSQTFYAQVNEFEFDFCFDILWVSQFLPDCRNIAYLFIGCIDLFYSFLFIFILAFLLQNG